MLWYIYLSSEVLLCQCGFILYIGKVLYCDKQMEHEEESLMDSVRSPLSSIVIEQDIKLSVFAAALFHLMPCPKMLAVST